MNKEVFKLNNDIISNITFGQSKEEITSRLALNQPDVPLAEITSLVDKVCDNFPDYPLIQKIMRSSLIIDKDDEDKKITIFDTSTRMVSTISNKRLNSLFNPKFAKTGLKSRTYTCLMDYMPYNQKFLIPDDNGAWTFNTYVPPFWQEDNFYSSGRMPLKKIKTVPQLYKDFLMHLVDSNKESYDYILDWLANALQSRNYCILTTIGRQGIGKGILGEIMRHLFGEDNFSLARDELFKSKFNSQLINKRLVYVDELKVDNDTMEDKVKAIINDYIEVEKKGVDAVQIKNYCNFYFSSNRLDSLKIPGDDRRFSIVDLTSEKLIEKYDTTDLTNKLFDKKNIDELACYLMGREVDSKEMMKVFVSKRTAEVRNSSLKDWEDWVLNDYGVEYYNTWISVNEVSSNVTGRFSGFTPGRKAYEKIQERFPERIEVKNKKIKGVQTWCIRLQEEKDL